MVAEGKAGALCLAVNSTSTVNCELSTVNRSEAGSALMEVVFWLLGGLIVYVYEGYPLLLDLLSML
ncbi:MAG: hypothetical protein ACREV5_00425, partial [Steroidobacter sp.]